MLVSIVVVLALLSIVVVGSALDVVILVIVVVVFRVRFFVNISNFTTTPLINVFSVRYVFAPSVLPNVKFVHNNIKENVNHVSS